MGRVEEFLTGLPEGFHYGARERIEVRQLVLGLIAADELPKDAAGLMTLLAPLVCSSRDQQREFYARFRDAWLDDGSLRTPSGLHRHFGLKKTPARKRKWVVAVARVLSLALVGLMGWKLRDWVETPYEQLPSTSCFRGRYRTLDVWDFFGQRVATPSTWPNNVIGFGFAGNTGRIRVVSAERSLAARLRPLRWLGPLLPLALIGAVLYWIYRKRSRLSRLSLDRNLTTYALRPPAAEKPFRPQDLRTVALEMRRRTPTPSMELAVAPTLHATARSAGFWLGQTEVTQAAWKGEQRRQSELFQGRPAACRTGGLESGQRLLQGDRRALAH